MLQSLLFTRTFPHEYRPTHQHTPTTDIYDSGDHYLLQIDAVGFSNNDIDIEATHNALSIKGNSKRTLPEGYKPIRGEFSADKHFQRRFRFRDHIDADLIEASVHNGLLEIKVPKKSARKIEVQVH